MECGPAITGLDVVMNRLNGGIISGVSGALGSLVDDTRDAGTDIWRVWELEVQSHVFSRRSDIVM